MAIVTGSTGAVSWASPYNLLFATDGLAGSWTGSITAPPIEITEFGATTVKQRVGMLSMGGVINGRIEGANIGIGGSVSWGSSFGYVSNTTRWALSMSAAPFDVTNFDSTSPWRDYIASIPTWGATYDGFLDDTTNVTRPKHAGESTDAATFTMDLDGTNTFAGSGVISSIDIGAQVNAPNTVSHTVLGSDDLAASGAHFWAASDVIIGSAANLTLTASTDQTFSGSAICTSLNISCPAPDLITVSAGFQFTGAVTIG